MVSISATNGASQATQADANQSGKVNNNSEQENQSSIFAKLDTMHGENVPQSEISSQEAGTDKLSDTLNSKLDNIKQSVNNLSTTMQKTSIAQKMLGLINSFSGKTQNVTTDITYQTTQEGADNADAEANSRLNMMSNIINEAKAAAEKDIEQEAKQEINDSASKYDTNQDEKITSTESNLKQAANDAIDDMKNAGIPESIQDETIEEIYSNVQDVSYDITQQNSATDADKTVEELEDNIDSITNDAIEEQTNAKSINKGENNLSQEDFDELENTKDDCITEIESQGIWGKQAIERAKNTLNKLVQDVQNKGEEATKEDIDNTKQKLESTKEQMIEKMNSNPDEKYRDKKIALSDGNIYILNPDSGKLYNVKNGRIVNDADKINEFKSKAG